MTKIVARQTSITVLLFTLALVAVAAVPSAVRKHGASPKSPAQQQSRPSAPPQKKAPSPILVQPPEEAGTRTYGARWEVGNGRNTALVLRTRQQNPVTANVVLFSSNGLQEQTAQITVAPNSVSRLDLSSIVKPDANSLHWGGLVVESNGAVSGELLIEDSRNGSSFTSHLMGGYRFDTENALYAPWWLPDDGTDGSLTIFNSSEQTITVVPSIAIAGAAGQANSPLTLGPHATAKVGLRELIGKDNNLGAGVAGSVTLRYKGPVHALQPLLLLANKATGFSLVPAFNAQHDQQAASGNTWQFPNISLVAATPTGPTSSEPLTNYALLSNGTGTALTPDLTAYFATGLKENVGKVVLPVAPLMPGETRLVRLSQFVDNGLVPSGVSRFALMIAHNGLPGDLGITVFSVGQSSGQVFPVTGMIRPAGTVDSSYWDIGHRAAVPALKNTINERVAVRVTMFFPGPYGVSSYALPIMNLQPHRSLPLGLRQIIHSGIADENGNRLPPGVSAGVVTLSLVDANGQTVAAAENAPECERECTPRAMRTGAQSEQPVLPVDTAAPAPSMEPPTPASAGVIFASTGCAPTVDGISPNNGFRGENYGVTITGHDFADTDTITVSDGISATILEVSPDGTTISAEFDIPSSTAAGDKSVVVSDLTAGDSNPVTFTVKTPPAPVIASISPSSGAGGSKVSVQINMTAPGVFRNGDQLNVTGINTTVDSVSSDGTVVTATFSLPLCTGDQQVTVVDDLSQTSNAVTFSVTDPPAPVINSISPTVWDVSAPQPIKVTIQGTNFGCNLSVTSSDGTIKFDQPVFTDETATAFTVNATLDPNDSGGQVQVFANSSSPAGATPAAGASAKSAVVGQRSAVGAGAQSSKVPGNNGLPGGKNTLAGQGKPVGQANPVSKGTTVSSPGLGIRPFFTSNPETVTVQAVQAPTPQIMFLGTDLANNAPAKTVWVGQQIILTANIPNLPAGTVISSETWTTPAGNLPEGNAIAAYYDGNDNVQPLNPPSAAGGKVKQLQPPTCGTTNSCNYQTDTAGNPAAFYWVDQAVGRKITFTYKLENGATGTATATFDVKGPTAAAAAAVTDVTTIAVVNGGPQLRFGDGTAAHIGIKFTAPALPQNTAGANVGAYMFIQLIKSDTFGIINGVGFHSCVHNGFVANPTTPELDGSYPYILLPNANTTNDSPNVKLAAFGYVSRAFAAKMYLMWDPALDANGNSGNCTIASTAANADGTPGASTASTCKGSIPVPVGSWDWSISCDAINTLSNATGQNNTQWKQSQGCGHNTQNPAFQAGLAFPPWSATVIAGDTKCTPP